MIYLVSTGDYSDYHIVGAFSTRELAEAFIAVEDDRASAEELPDGTIKIEHAFRVEEYPIDVKPEAPTNGRWRATAVSSHESIGLWWQGTGDPHESARVEEWHPGHGNEWRVVGYGPTREHAARAVREVVRAIRAGTLVAPPKPEPPPKPKTTWFGLPLEIQQDPSKAITDASNLLRQQGEAWPIKEGT